MNNKISLFIRAEFDEETRFVCCSFENFSTSKALERDRKMTHYSSLPGILNTIFITGGNRHDMQRNTRGFVHCPTRTAYKEERGMKNKSKQGSTILHKRPTNIPDREIIRFAIPAWNNGDGIGTKSGTIAL